MPKLENELAFMNFAQEPKVYVDALLEVHKKNADTVTRSFKGEAGFVASLDRVRASHLRTDQAESHMLYRPARSSSTRMERQAYRQANHLNFSRSMRTLFCGRITSWQKKATSRMR